MKINNSDVKAAFLLAAENEFSDVPEESDLSHSFSPRFVEWGEWMVTYRFPVKHIRSAKRIVRAILIAALIAALLVGTVMAFPAVREAVKKFFVRNAYLTDNVSFNNGYNCRHPKQTETHEEDGKTFGACFCHSCPLGYPASVSDLVEHGFMSEEEADDCEYDDGESLSDYIMVTDPDVLKLIELCMAERGGKA